MSTPTTPTEEMAKTAALVQTAKQRGFVAQLSAQSMPDAKIAALLPVYKQQDEARAVRYDGIVAAVTSAS